MLLEIRTASRKTPRDGRFEITSGTADRLSALGASISIVLDDVAGTAVVERLACTCDKAGQSGGHEHQFLVSDLLRTATPERTYVLEQEEGGRLRLTSAHDGLA